MREPKTGSNIPDMGITNSTPLFRPSRRRPPITHADDVPTSIADALFTTTRQRLLGLLFGQLSRSLFATELIALAGCGPGAVQRELKRLVSSGLVDVAPIGRQKHYQANPKSPVFEELRGLVVKTVAAAQPIREALEPLPNRV